jgi:glycosyltransferase involved in cell wall biosynthesis
MRLSIVLTDTRRGGTPARMGDLAVELTRRGWVVEVISLMPAGDMAEELLERGVTTRSLDLEGAARLPGAVVGLRRELRRFAPSLVQTALFHANVLGRLVARSLGLPVVSGYQSVDDEMALWRLVADRLTAPLATRHVAVSQAVADRVRSRVALDVERVDVIPIGKRPPTPGDRKAIRRALGIPQRALVVGFVGRLHRVKDLPTLATALDLMKDEPWLLVVGDGPERLRMESRPRTVFAGMHRDVGPYLGAMNVFALASRWEGMPGALVEAMAVGLPVVATRVGGIPEVVTDGVDGLLVPAGDPRALALAIGRAKTMPELGQRAKETARERHSLEAMVDAYEATYRAVLG